MGRVLLVQSKTYVSPLSFLAIYYYIGLLYIWSPQYYRHITLGLTLISLQLYCNEDGYMKGYHSHKWFKEL